MPQMITDGSLRKNAFECRVGSLQVLVEPGATSWNQRQAWPQDTLKDRLRTITSLGP